MTRAHIEFAHDGQGFPTWHRLYMFTWGKKTLHDISNDEKLCSSTLGLDPK